MRWRAWVCAACVMVGALGGGCGKDDGFQKNLEAARARKQGRIEEMKRARAGTAEALARARGEAQRKIGRLGEAVEKIGQAAVPATCDAKRVAAVVEDPNDRKLLLFTAERVVELARAPLPSGPARIDDPLSLGFEPTDVSFPEEERGAGDDMADHARIRFEKMAARPLIAVLFTDEREKAGVVATDDKLALAGGHASGRIVVYARETGEPLCAGRFAAESSDTVKVAWGEQGIEPMDRETRNRAARSAAAIDLHKNLFAAYTETLAAMSAELELDRE